MSKRAAADSSNIATVSVCFGGCDHVQQDQGAGPDGHRDGGDDAQSLNHVCMRTLPSAARRVRLPQAARRG